MADPYDDLERDGNSFLLGEKQDIPNRALYIIITSILLSLCYLWFMVDTDDLRQEINTELNYSQTIFTKSKADEMVNRTSNWYQRSVVDTGVEAFFNGMYVPHPKADKKGQKSNALVMYSDFTYTFIENTKLFFYRAILRLNVLFEWSLMAFILIYAFYSDAYYDYRLRIAHSQKQNIKAGVISGKIMLVIFVMIYFYVVLPINNEMIWRFAPMLFIGALIIFGVTMIRQFHRNI